MNESEFPPPSHSSPNLHIVLISIPAHPFHEFIDLFSRFLENLKADGRGNPIMEANAGMVAGSHKRNELVRIRHDSSDNGVCFFSFIFLVKFKIFHGPVSLFTRISFPFHFSACVLGLGSECGSPV